MQHRSSHVYARGDPKFWSAHIRYAVLANLCIFAFLGNMYAAGLSTGFVELAQDFHTSFSTLTDLISWSVFALGVSNLFWMPTALCIGKRPVVLLSMTLFLAACIWSIKAKTFSSLLASRIVASFGAGSVEALGPSIIADLFFERYFATAMALFSLFLTAGSQLGPMIAGFLIGARGWQWHFILCAILIAVNLLCCVFFLPETTFRRANHEGETAAEVDKGPLQTVEYIDQEQLDQEQIPTNAQPNETPRAPYAGTYWTDLRQFKDRGLETGGLRKWPLQFSLPFRFILVPSVLFASCAYGIVLSGIVVISALGPILLSPPPYLFTPSAIGLFTLASFVGIIIAYPLAGPLTDLLSMLMGRRNGNVHEPEHRMPALIFPFLISPPGLILFAYMIAEGRSFYISAVGYAMQSTAMVFVPSVVLSYVVDAYPQTGGEALVLINAGKNLIAFGVTLSCSHWLVREGLTKMFCELAAAQWGVLLLAIPLYYSGPWLRKESLRLLS